MSFLIDLKFFLVIIFLCFTMTYKITVSSIIVIEDIQIICIKRAVSF